MVFKLECLGKHPTSTERCAIGVLLFAMLLASTVWPWLIWTFESNFGNAPLIHQQQHSYHYVWRVDGVAGALQPGMLGQPSHLHTVMLQRPDERGMFKIATAWLHMVPMWPNTVQHDLTWRGLAWSTLDLQIYDSSGGDPIPWPGHITCFLLRDKPGACRNIVDGVPIF